jgi:hypothetical protein
VPIHACVRECVCVSGRLKLTTIACEFFRVNYVKMCARVCVFVYTTDGVNMTILHMAVDMACGCV